MTLKNTHPTLESIMEFASLSNDTFDKGRSKDYFAMAVHFSKCEHCCRIKDEMVAFGNKIDSIVLNKGYDNRLKLKVYYSMMKLDISKEWKDREIYLSMKGKISKVVGQSGIRSLNQDKIADNVTVEHDKYQNEFRIDGFGRVLIGNEKIKVDLYDKGEVRHSMLLIPENAKNPPMFCVMEKSDNLWTASCDCPEDDYDIVLF